jgi:hypothetical protein
MATVRPFPAISSERKRRLRIRTSRRAPDKPISQVNLEQIFRSIPMNPLGAPRWVTEMAMARRRHPNEATVLTTTVFPKYAEIWRIPDTTDTPKENLDRKMKKANG